MNSLHRELNDEQIRYLPNHLGNEYEQIGFESINLTSSTNGSYLECFTWCLRKTGLGVLSKVSIDSLKDERHEQLNKRSWGVVFVEVHKSDLIEFNTSGNTTSQCFIYLSRFAG